MSRSKRIYRRGYDQHPRSLKSRMLAKICCEFPKRRPDLRHSSVELREARLAFAAGVLGLDGLTTMSRLTREQLGRIIEALRIEPRGQGAGCSVHHLKPRQSVSGAREPAEIHHLAGPEQVWAIEALFDDLGWSTERRRQFLENKFSRHSPRMLSAAQGNSAIMILLTIAAHRDLRREVEGPISRALIGGRIPAVKRRLGIDLRGGTRE